MRGTLLGRTEPPLRYTTSARLLCTHRRTMPHHHLTGLYVGAPMGAEQAGWATMTCGAPMGAEQRGWEGLPLGSATDSVISG